MSQQTDGPLLSETNHRIGVILDSLTAGLVGPLVDGAIPLLDWSPGAGSATRATEPDTGGGDAVRDLRERFTKHLHGIGEFPGYCDVGLGYFKAVHDWHVRYRQPILITRDSENRLMIQLMFTQLVLRSEMGDYYCGLPYDR